MVWQFQKNLNIPEEDDMRRKLVVLVLVFMVIFASSLSAEARAGKETSSKFDVGLIMNYSYADLRDQNYSKVVPTLRFQLNLLPWLGISATGYASGQEFIAIIGEVVLRAPLGLIEPYIATGPGYLFAYDNDSPESGTSNFAFNFRAGFDVNLTSWFSIGPGITLLVHEVNDFFTNISTLDMQYLKDSSLIGIGAKLRF